MPHDAKGNELKVGDLVLLPAKITAIQPTEEYCNCTIEPLLQMPPYPEDGSKFAISAINTRQLYLDIGVRFGTPPPNLAKDSIDASSN